MSFTKTLVPRSPSGINLIGECDIFYPLQNRIEDWYPTQPPLPPPPPPPPPPTGQEQAQEEEEDSKQGVLSANVGPSPPNEPPMPLINPQINSQSLPLPDVGKYSILYAVSLSICGCIEKT